MTRTSRQVAGRPANHTTGLVPHTLPDSHETSVWPPPGATEHHYLDGVRTSADHTTARDHTKNRRIDVRRRDREPVIRIDLARRRPAVRGDPERGARERH